MTTEIFDELAIESEFNYEAETTDDRAYYAAKYEDDLEVWTAEDVAAALDCGAITQAQAAEIETFDEETWERDNAEHSKQAQAIADGFMRAWVPAWVGTFGKDSVGGTFMGGLVKRGVFTEEEALALID